MVQFVETIYYETFGFELAGMATWLTSLGVCFHHFWPQGFELTLFGPPRPIARIPCSVQSWRVAALGRRLTRSSASFARSISTRTRIPRWRIPQLMTWFDVGHHAAGIANLATTSSRPRRITQRWLELVWRSTWASHPTRQSLIEGMMNGARDVVMESVVHAHEVRQGKLIYNWIVWTCCEIGCDRNGGPTISSKRNSINNLQTYDLYCRHCTMLAWYINIWDIFEHLTLTAWILAWTFYSWGPYRPYLLISHILFLRGDAKTVAEQSSGFETKQVLGYLWTPALLKKHGKEVPRKLQTITHQGRQVKGVVLEEFVVGF